jgi:hypothetical protein
MKSIQKLLVGLGFVLVVWFMFFSSRTRSCADPIIDPASLGKGALLKKTPEESCQTKYGDEWSQLSSMVCKKK